MAYDEGLVERVRSVVEGEPKVSEKRMFGGLCFLVDDKMFAGVRDELLVRVGKAQQAAALEHAHVRPMTMGERVAHGFVYVAPEAVDRDEDLERWVKLGLSFARSLPVKKATERKTSIRKSSPPKKKKKKKVRR